MENDDAAFDREVARVMTRAIAGLVLVLAVNDWTKPIRLVMIMLAIDDMRNWECIFFVIDLLIRWID